MAYLSNIEFHNRVDMSGLLTEPVDRTKPVLGAFVWMDRNRQYFIFTEVSMDKGRPYTCTGWRQENSDPNADPNMVEITIPHTITEELYYSTCGNIDRQNRCRQESLDIEKKLGTKYWSKRFNISVFVINVDDGWLAYQGITGTAETQADFYNYLAEEMIDNTYNMFVMQSAEGRRINIVDSDDETFDYYNPLIGRINGDPRCGISLHVTPTKNKRKKRYGTEIQYLFQGECNFC